MTERVTRARENIEELSSLQDHLVKFNREQIQSIPDEILREILTFLPPNDITNVALANHEWKQITDHEFILKYRLLNHYGQIVFDNFIPLVENRVISLEDIPYYHSLTSFLSKITNKINNFYGFLGKYNPELSYRRISIPKSFVNYGDYNFFVCNLFDVKIIEIESGENRILKGDGENRITHIAVEKKFLFCLRTDGIIIQWDYERDVIVQEIQSEYFKRNNKLERSREAIEQMSQLRRITQSIAEDEGFLVQDGYIIINYARRPYPLQILEIIPYSNPSQNQLIEDVCKISAGKMYINQDKLYQIREKELFVFDINEERKLPTIQNSTYICTMNIQKNTIFIYGFKTIHVIDIETGREKEQYTLSEFTEIVVIENILFGFYLYSKKIIAINLDSKSIIERIPFTFNTEIMKIENRSNLLERCIGICRENPAYVLS